MKVTPPPEDRDVEMIENWLATRPPKIQRLAKEFPIGSSFETPAPLPGTYYVTGYCDGDVLIVSETYPGTPEEWEKAFNTREYVHAQHLREP